MNASVLVEAMRKGEVLGVPDSHVDEDAAEIDIGYQLQRVSKELLHRETKTEDSDATLPLADVAVESDPAATHTAGCGQDGRR